jgi:hypothetical protein
MARSTTLPQLSDEAAGQLLEMLYELAATPENHCAAQLRRYHGDFFADFDDDLPDF